MTNQVQVDKIRDYLASDASVSTIVGNRVYWGEPREDDQPGIYITLNVVSETNAFANKGTRIEVRMLSNDDSVTYKQLFGLRESVTNRFVKDCGTIDMDGFVVYGITELDTTIQGVDIK